MLAIGFFTTIHRPYQPEQVYKAAFKVCDLGVWFVIRPESIMPYYSFNNFPNFSPIILCAYPIILE